MKNKGVVLLKEVADNRLRLIYREDGNVVKHDFHSGWREKRMIQSNRFLSKKPWEKEISL